MIPYFAPPRPRVFAHRGLATGIADNTLLAFERALQAGAGYLELDVHASRDGVAVVAHDADLRRLAGSERTIASLTLAELRTIDLGHAQRLSTLAEVLAAFPTARLNIDVKAQAAIPSVAKAIRRAGALDRVLVASFSERRRSATVKLLPGVASAASSTVLVLAVVAATLRLTPLLRFSLRRVHAVQIPESFRGISLATRRMIDAFHGAGVEVHIWTVNERATMERLLDLGIDGLVTDRADVAVRLLEERSPTRRL
ncbi:glycerophosphoryl diester phosphodiesterase [Glaciihabitans tibetensis]|uniref:Glycerophosphoryl diester phosphodiesterase n=1 Tax=Glaciihabitans tibetensis TaxID=1266600 RepID=A0A2T0VK23_9MICO|nr:glycerophosphodiester phosphodiesterase [Glaciihabitans tibetensis]PRY70539.1 glycerophosphoryl diester phosphodiesterase [Glaciihabitans tibetensis]